MQKSLAEIARIVEGELVGDKDVVIKGLSGIEDAKEGDLTFLSKSKYLPLLSKTKASAVITSRDMKVTGKPVIYTDNPSLAFARIAAVFAQASGHPFRGIHESACISPDAKIGRDVSIGPFAVVEKGATIGDSSVIYGGVYVGEGVRIGANCLIYPNVNIMHSCIIGDRVNIHPGSVIGSDGFGYEQVNGKHVKISQTGIVVIEDDVEVGANVTIDRARFDKTLIGKGTKIDNLVHIAHNVTIGENCIIIAQVGISGSVTVGKNSILAGQAGVTGHLTIGEGSIVASQAGVTKSFPPRSVLMGFPAKPQAQAKRVNACLQRLPHYVDMIREMEKKIAVLEQRLVDKSQAKVAVSRRKKQ